MDRSNGRPRWLTWILCALAMCSAVVAASCARPSSQKVQDILARSAPVSENSFYACLLTYYLQGLPLKQIQELCETKLGLDDKKGFGERGADFGPFTQPSRWFDPGSVTAACHPGKAGIAAGTD